MREYILRENVLTDDILFVADKGKVFKGGYIALIKEYTFLNEWCDKETVKYFRKESSLERYLVKKYPDFEIYE